MFKMHTAHIPANPGPMDCYLKLVLDCLRMKGRIPSHRPANSYPSGVHLDALEHFTVEREADGWTFYVSFAGAAHEAPNTIALPPHARCRDAISAFLLGAQTVCEIVTGRPDLPFAVQGNRISFAIFRL